MRTRWSPSALQGLTGCPRRFALREDNWTPRPDPMKPSEPHAQFGRIWHAAAETFDRAMFRGAAREDATDETVEFALTATWDYLADQPWAGATADEWRCAGGKVPSEKTGKPVQCPASKGWWIVGPLDLHAACPKCGGPIEIRHALIPHHKGKSRITLLRAVVDYCDEALPGVAPVPALHSTAQHITTRDITSQHEDIPGLEIHLEFRLGGLNLHTILDRYTAIDTTRLAHERKTSSRWPFWDGYLQTFQVRLYPEALRQNGLRCDGVLIEHYQIQAGGTHRSTVTLSPGPDHMVEAIASATRSIEAVEQWQGHDPLDWPPNFAHCARAAGGKPCDFLKVCRVAFQRRPEILASDFIQVERGT